MPSGYDLRAIHFQQSGGGLHAYYRLTFPLVVAKGMGPKRADGFFGPPSFTILRVESAHAFYYPDVEAIRRAPLDLAKLVASGHRLESGGTVITPDVVSVRVYPKGHVPPFNTLAQVQSSTQPGEAYPGNAAEVDAAYAVVDVHMVYPRAGEEFSLSSTLDNRVIGQPEIQNLIVDHRPQGDVIYRSSGPLNTPVLINPSRWSAIKSFVAHGAEHVLSGMDHLLLILCLALGAAGIASLAWRVTGFTLGHTVSLILGFWGYVPNAAWFAPAVESTIALSILIAAASLFLERIKPPALMGVIVIVGFVHGLGFSLGLREMLDAKGPHVWTSLAAFNAGVELGQIAFATAVIAIFQLAWRQWPTTKGAAIRAIALLCMAMSVYWAVERLRPVFV
jgi:HupE / UreJ protein